ncbi:MAG: hypothetical protein WBD27_07135 [Pyrinomonadaceae bacterium]
MTVEFNPIYYVSRSLIDQIYKSKFGPLEDLTITQSKENKVSLGVKLALDKLIAFLTGTNLNLEAALEHKRGVSEARAIRESAEDRSLVILRELLSDLDIKDISSILLPNEPESAYVFSLPLKLINKAVKTGKGSIVEVSHISPFLSFSGSTSCDNWPSQSLLNTLLWSSAKNKTVGIVMGGVLHPITVTRKDNKVIAMVQYLFLFPVSLFQEEP